MKKVFLLALSLLMCFSAAGCSDSAENLSTAKARPDDLVAAVKSEDGYVGFINTKGEWTIPPKYDQATAFFDGIAAVSISGMFTSHLRFIDKNGNQLAECEEGLYLPTYNSWSWEDKLFYMGASDIISDGVLLVRNYDPSSNTKYGYVNTKGKTVVKPTYYQAKTFSEGLAAVDTGTLVETGQWSYINPLGEIAIKGPFDYAGSFSEGLAFVQGSGGWGFIDRSGNMVIEGGHALTKFKNGMVFVKYSSPSGELSIAVLDKTGKKVWQGPYGDPKVPAQPIGEGSEYIGDGLFQVATYSSNGNPDSFGFLDTSGSLAIPLQKRWQAMSPFSEGLCCVLDHNTGYYGYIDQTGKIVIPAGYKYTCSFLNGFAAAMRRDGTYLYIDHTGAPAAQGDYVCIGMPFTR